MAMFNCSSCSNACDFYERTVTAGCLLLALAMLNVPVVSPSTNCSKYFIALHCSQSFGPTGYAPARICPPPTPPFGFANQSAYEATLLTATNYFVGTQFCSIPNHRPQATSNKQQATSNNDRRKRLASKQVCLPIQYC